MSISTANNVLNLLTYGNGIIVYAWGGPDAKETTVGEITTTQIKSTHSYETDATVGTTDYSGNVYGLTIMGEPSYRSPEDHENDLIKGYKINTMFGKDNSWGELLDDIFPIWQKI